MTNFLVIIFCVFLFYIGRYLYFKSNLDNKSLDINYVIEQAYYDSSSNFEKQLYRALPMVFKEKKLEMFKKNNPAVINKLKEQVATNLANSVVNTFKNLDINISADEKANLAAAQVLSNPLNIAILGSSKVISASPEVSKLNNALSVNLSKVKVDLIKQLIDELNNKVAKGVVKKAEYNNVLVNESKKINDFVNNTIKSQLTLASASMAASKVSPIKDIAINAAQAGLKSAAQSAASDAAQAVMKVLK